MKILYVITGLRFGGAEKLLYLTCKWMLQKHDVVIHIIYFDPVAPLLEPLRKLGINCRQIDRSLFGVLQLRRVIRAEDYDVVHTHLIHADILGRIAVFISGNLRARVFTTVHGTEWFRREKSIVPQLVRYVDRMLSIPSRVRIIAISQSVQRILVESENISPKKITLLYNAVQVPEERGLVSADRCSVVYVGRLAEEKNIPCLIHAFEEIKSPEISLSIVGAGPMEGKLNSLVTKLDLRSQVDFKSARFDLSTIYRNHDILVLPSNSEGLGIVILEAFSYKLAVIGSNVEGIREILADDRGLLFERDDSSALAEKIKLLCSDAQKRKELAELGFKYVRKNHNIASYVDKLFTLYQNEKF